MAAPGEHRPLLGSEVVDWITNATVSDRTITTAIPPAYASYATAVIPDGDTLKAAADSALVEILHAHTPAQPWWLGYLDTGVADLVAADMPKVAVYGWEYVLLEGGPEPALTSRRHSDATPWHSALPELMFPRDRSWLVSTLWDDTWRCIGGPAALIDALLQCSNLDARAVTLDEEAAPPGHNLD